MAAFVYIKVIFDMRPVNLRKGNCYIYSILFKLKNPKAKIKPHYNKYGNMSVAILFEGKEYYYVAKIKSDKQKFYFIGVVKIVPHGSGKLKKENQV